MNHPIEVLKHELGDADNAAPVRQRARLLASQAPVRRRPRWLLVPALVPVALALALVLWPAPRLALEVGRPLSAEESPTEFSFPDGSRLTLAPETRAHLEAFDEAHADIAIDSGRVTAEVRKGTHRVWRYHAGPFTITVVGTVLSVGWAPERAEVEVAVSEGRVSVTGPGLDTPLFVGPGESLRRVLTPVRTTPPLETTPTLKAPRIVPPPSTTRRSWQDALQQGHWREALELAEAAGVLTDSRTLSSDELLELADAARLESRLELALWLLGDRLERGGAGEAHAAFMRGQLLAEHQRLRPALDDFERSLAVEPRGPFAQNALGRTINVNLELGEVARAGCGPAVPDRVPAWPLGARSLHASSVVR